MRSVQFFTFRKGEGANNQNKKNLSDIASPAEFEKTVGVYRISYHFITHESNPIERDQIHHAINQHTIKIALVIYRSHCQSDDIE